MTEIRYNFEWDPWKAVQNQQKHGISFEEAATVFLDPAALTIFDDEHSDKEERWITLGKTGQGSILVVVHTFWEDGPNEASIRLISARHVTKRERLDYEVRP